MLAAIEWGHSVAVFVEEEERTDLAFRLFCVELRLRVV